MQPNERIELLLKLIAEYKREIERLRNALEACNEALEYEQRDGVVVPGTPPAPHNSQKE